MFEETRGVMSIAVDSYKLLGRYSIVPLTGFYAITQKFGLDMEDPSDVALTVPFGLSVGAQP